MIKYMMFIPVFFFVLFNIGCNKDIAEKEIRVTKSENNKKADEDKESRKDAFEESSGLVTITSKEVKYHIGDSLKIRGNVADIYLGEKVAYLNFGNKFPKNDFSCAVFSGKFEEFGDLSKFKNKNVEITGKISTYKNKPQVILNSKHQIKIIQ